MYAQASRRITSIPANAPLAAALDAEATDFETAASMLDRVATTLCPHDPAEHHTAPDVTNGRPLTTCYACGLTWYTDYPERLQHVTGYHEEGRS